MKKCVAWLLSLCLLLTGAAPALAAPLRDAQAMELTVDLGMTSLLEMVLGAAVNRDVDSLPAGEAPSQALMEGVLTLGLYQLALPYSGNELFQGAATLSQTEIAEMYGDIFTSGAYAEITAPTCPCITAEKGALRFDLSSLKENPVVGVFVYSTRFDGTDADVLCDLYLYYGEMGQSAEALPEDALTWLCQAQVSLRSAPETLYGYTVNGFSLSPTYQDGMLADWQETVNEEYGYSFNLPSILGLAQEDAAHRVWQTADGAASLSIEATAQPEGGFEALLMDFRAQARQMDVQVMEDVRRFSVLEEGAYTLCVAPEGNEWAYWLILTFPAERQAEYALYAEFLYNSFSAQGEANG